LGLFTGKPLADLPVGGLRNLLIDRADAVGWQFIAWNRSEKPE